MAMNFDERRDKLRGAVGKSEADALLVTDPVNVTYLTGFTGGDSYLLVRADGDRLLSDGRFTTQLQEECPGLDLMIRKPGTSIPDAAVDLIGAAKLSRLAIEAESMTVSLREYLAEKLPRIRLLPTSGLVEVLRQIKDQDEIVRIRRSIWVAQKAFEAMRATLRADKTEKQVGDELELHLRQFGATCSGFPSIIGVGERAALPHGSPGGRQIGAADLLLVDWGADVELYKSDLTRVLVTGKISPKLERIYGVVLKAQLAAIDAIRPGVKAEDVDAAARSVIAEAGFADQFNHGLGHGFGLQIHESPRMRPGNTAVLQAGMVVTVEPGIYLPDWGGVRIEDDVLITGDGHEVLTSIPKRFDEVVVQLS